MYRRSRKYQQLIERLARGRAAREKRRMEGHHPDFSPELPELRRLIEITDFDTGTPITHRIELYRSNRIDGYNVVVNGNLWKRCIGSREILEGLCKGLPRLRSDV